MDELRELIELELAIAIYIGHPKKERNVISTITSELSQGQHWSRPFLLKRI